ncbi:hypothetical protein GCM10017044_28890 [Kordiimonas sediminis]|uniref:Zinc finger CHC2-type domain-containing protein n=2 Tax=Kordiimonas sediminis TaxID=1735581 RepID=A0A919AZ24_9PROT|nr:hypothetical protein GCM10017044_28890 [Kordiimonas sediminis]
MMHRPDIFADTRSRLHPKLELLVPSLLPQGRRQGMEWIALNPTRTDRKLGSFRINLKSGAWADFATGDSGGDLVSLASYLYGLPPLEAVKLVRRMAGVAND